MGGGRSGEPCVRPGRRAWHGDRAETAVRPATAVGRSDHRAGYAAGAVADEPRLPCTGSLRDRAADGDLRLLRGADRNGRATGDGGTRRLHPACAGGDRSACATRAYPRTDEGRRSALRWAVTDSTIALTLALFINASILILAAAVFHANGRFDVEDIEQAHQLLAPMLGVGAAATLFAIALLASGLNSTVTATLAGQIVMEGFLHLRLPPWLRRLITRALAIIPVVVVIVLFGDQGAVKLLVLSQVVLSMQLPFAIIPLVRIVTAKVTMGALVAPRWLGSIAWVIALVIVVLNVKLLVDTFAGA
ncbi:hypothetical protein G6F50_013806 [Rhizopus delemar]|uniref:Divalent metal cation transporter MntH n=1 Tax=Rhizopus delemar TaxID=936053 RepID=A0A9P7CBD9_9FUNG|nr:hypothetical protein G6F50_013806 [Rhizopus delemar]